MKNVKLNTFTVWLKFSSCINIVLFLLFLIGLISCKSDDVDSRKSTTVIANPFKPWSILLLPQTDFASGYVRFDSFGNPIPNTLKITLTPGSQTWLKIIKKLLDLLPTDILSQIGNKSSIDEIDAVLRKNKLKIIIFLGTTEYQQWVRNNSLSNQVIIDFSDLKSYSIPFTEKLIDADAKLVQKFSTYKSIVSEVTGSDGLKYAEVNRSPSIPFFEFIVSGDKLLTNNSLSWTLGSWEIKVDKVSGTTSIIAID